MLSGLPMPKDSTQCRQDTGRKERLLTVKGVQLPCKSAVKGVLLPGMEKDLLRQSKKEGCISRGGGVDKPKALLGNMREVLLACGAVQQRDLERFGK